MHWIVLFIAAGAGCATDASVPSEPTPPSPDSTLQPIVSDGGASGPLLTVSRDSVEAAERFAPAEPLVFELRVPAVLRGGGLPSSLTDGAPPAGDRSILQIELPLFAAPGSSDEQEHGSFGVAQFDPIRLCWTFQVSCENRGVDGSWRAVRVRPDGTTTELQMAVALQDSTIAGRPYDGALGVYLARTGSLAPGDRVRIEYVGHVPARATEWTDRPFIVHFRYRSYDAALPGGGPWTLLTDEQVQPMQIRALAEPSFVRAIAPLDVAAGEELRVQVVVTDRYGNPCPIEGPVALTGGVTATLFFAGEWRQELTAVYPTAGAYRIVPSLPGARSIYHYTMAWDGPPPFRRLVGDTHIHTGDGGAQRRFVGSFMPGDHAALYSRTRDALGYLERVAGYDFGSVSEHAVRDSTTVLPPAVLADPAFREGGACAGAGTPVPGLSDWWPYAQSVAREVADEAGERGFTVFPAYEWHSTHSMTGDRSLLHRVVLFREFDAGDALPLLPGDVSNLEPECLLRFLSLAGYDPTRALAIPHMMMALPSNIDWDLTYGATDLVTRETIEDYHRIGEIFSARSYDQPGRSGRSLLTAMEGDRLLDPGRWTYRYGWRDRSAHIGVIGSSDNHQQFPGVNDDLAPDGTRYHQHEPAGTAVVLSGGPGRDGIFDAMRDRRTYATSGVRAWLSFAVADAPMGSRVTASGDRANLAAALMAGMTITLLEVHAAPVGVPDAAWQRVLVRRPSAESAVAVATVPNPVAAGGPPAEWVYTLRAFLESPGAEDGEPDDAVWSSPVWVTWSR